MLRQEIKKIIGRAVSSAGLQTPEIAVEHPVENQGDFATNVALKLAQTLKIAPAKIAENIKYQILNAQPGLFEKIEVKEPGFINFFIAKEYLQKQVEEILKQKEKFGQLEIGKGKKVNLEYCSANPTGPLHLGHGRGAFWGDVLANIFEKAGYKVTREYFINDYGKQILLLGQSIDARYQELLGQKAETKEEFYKGEYVKDIAQEIFQKDKDKYLKLAPEERVKVFADFGFKKMLDGIKELLEKVGVKYDVWFSERNLYEKNLVKKGIALLKGEKFTYEKEGALWFESGKFGDDKDRVLVKADGEPTYFASDVAYHLDKVSRGYDLMINGWGADHWGYRPRLMAAAKVFGFEQKLKIVVGQFVRLVEKGQEVKMSKRGGTFFALEDLVKEIGTDIARFFFLTKSVDTHMDFNLDLAKEQSEKNPVYYVQYAHARICSIMSKVRLSEAKPQSNLLNHPSELSLIKQLIRFPEIIEDTVNDYQTQRIPQYAMDLATMFHQFYRDCKVLTNNRPLQGSRLALVLATKIILANTLSLMGISAPEKM